MREKYTNSMKKHTENAFHKVNDDFKIQIGDIESILDLEEDKKIIEAVRAIVERGNSAEDKKK